MKTHLYIFILLERIAFGTSGMGWDFSPFTDVSLESSILKLLLDSYFRISKDALEVHVDPDYNAFDIFFLTPLMSSRICPNWSFKFWSWEFRNIKWLNLKYHIVSKDYYGTWISNMNPLLDCAGQWEHWEQSILPKLTLYFCIGI